MSRSDAQQASNTARDQNSKYYANSQNSYTQAQKDAGDYSAGLSKYAADNPFTDGGAYETATNREMSNTADASARAAGQALQGAAARTGTNQGGAIAGTEAMQQQNERNLGADEANATQSRLGAKAAYDSSVLGDQATAQNMEANLAGNEGNLAGGAASNENTANAQNQSFMDQLGSSFTTGLGGMLGGSSVSFKGPCWIAAELFGGWMEPRTVLARNWIFGSFAETRIGGLVAELYAQHGERMAERIRTNRLLRLFFRGVFEVVLWRARAAERKKLNAGRKPGAGSKEAANG